MNNLDLATLVFGPTPSDAYSFTEPQQEEVDIIHGGALLTWLLCPLHLCHHLTAWFLHLTLMNWKGCLIIFDQVMLRSPIFAVDACNQRELEKFRSIRGIDKATHTLHIDIAGPFAPLVHRAGLPAKLPPAMNIDELAGPDPLPSSFDRPLQDKCLEDKLSKDPLDLDPLPSDSLQPTLRNDTLDDKSDDLAKDQERTDRHEDTTNDDSDDDDVILEFSLSEVYSSLPFDCHSPSCTYLPKIRLGTS